MDERIWFSEKTLARISSRIEVAERYVGEDLLTAAAVQLITQDAPAMVEEIERLRGIESFSDRVVEFIRARGLGRELARFLSGSADDEAACRTSIAAAGD